MNLSARFKSLPVSTKKLLGLGIVFALVIALPLFVWAIVTQRFNLGKKAASGEPIPAPTPVNNSVNWTTPYASLSASNFYITVDEVKLFTGTSVSIHSDPGDDTYTTLELTWRENNADMGLTFYFKMENNLWRVTEVRTGDGSTPGNTLYYPGFAGAAKGSPLIVNNFNLISQDGRGKIHFENLNLQAFLPIAIPPSSYGYILEPKPLTTIQMIYSGPNSNTGYGVNAVLRDANFNVITDQSAFNYNWTSSNTNVVSAIAEQAGDSNACFFGINQPCPYGHASLTATGVGNATVTANVIRKSDGVTIASANFIVSISPTTPTPMPTATPTAPPSTITCPGNPFTLEVSPSYQQSNPGGTLRYSVLVTNNNSPACDPVLANLIVDKPSNWTANFGTQSFNLSGNTTYSTHVDITSPTSNYFLGPQPISVRVSTIYGTTNSQTVTYDLVNKPLYQILKFLFKFSGVTDGSADGGNIAVRFVKPNFFDFFISPVKTNYVGNGIYSATVAFATTMAPGLPAGNDYTIYLKGEKHLARKFCYQSGQTTRCTTNGYISIAVTDTQAEQVFDFTGLPLEPGDVYPQDGAADLSDFGKIKSLLSKLSTDLTAQDKLVGDLDYNGIINVRDLFLMRKTLESKYDEN